MQQLSKNRLEAFSDAVIAIIITIMVLELRPPAQATFIALQALLPIVSSYVLSFVYLGTYWNNHHHMLHAATHINGRVMWANLHLLFWLSLFPFATAWVGKAHAAPLPTAFYGFVLLMGAIAYWILQSLIIQVEGKGSMLAKVIGHMTKEKISIVCYILAVGFAFVAPWISIALYVAVALMWIVPDTRIERNTRLPDE